LSLLEVPRARISIDRCVAMPWRGLYHRSGSPRKISCPREAVDKAQREGPLRKPSGNDETCAERSLRFFNHSLVVEKPLRRRARSRDEAQELRRDLFALGDKSRELRGSVSFELTSGLSATEQRGGASDLREQATVSGSSTIGADRGNPESGTLSISCLAST